MNPYVRRYPPIEEQMRGGARQGRELSNDRFKPTVKCQQTRVMAHAADVTGEVSADFAALRPKTNMNLYSPNKLILLPMLDILADKTAQANVMH